MPSRVPSTKDTADEMKGMMTHVEITDPKNVHEAVIAVMSRCGYVQKETTSGLNYSFASEPAFIRAIRPHMVDVGLYVRPIKMVELQAENFESKRGSIIQSRRLQVTYEFVHVYSQTSMIVEVVGEGMDSGDKATNKAMTVAYKYALRQTFLIETGDDPDFTPSDELERAIEREREIRSDPRPAGKSNGKRVKNQWESDAITAIVKSGLVDNRVHAVNILNNSPFFDAVPYGELHPHEAVAFALAWKNAPVASTVKAEDKAKIVETIFQEKKQAFLDEAEALMHDDVGPGDSPY